MRPRTLIRFLLALLLVPGLSLAQGTRPPATEGAPEQGVAKQPVPPTAELTSASGVQALVAAIPERLFATVDVWKLEAGQHLAELATDALIGGVGEAGTLARVRLGLSDHFEVGVGQAVVRDSGQPLALASTPLTVRYSLGASSGGGGAVLRCGTKRFRARTRELRVRARGNPVPLWGRPTQPIENLMSRPWPATCERGSSESAKGRRPGAAGSSSSNFTSVRCACFRRTSAPRNSPPTSWPA